MASTTNREYPKYEGVNLAKRILGHQGI